MFKKLFITCDQATAICDKNQYGEATFGEKFLLTIHFIRCGFCKKYTKHNELLSKCYHKKAEEAKNREHTLSDVEKATMKKKLEEVEV